jgi:hypothetical protein
MRILRSPAVSCRDSHDSDYNRENRIFNPERALIAIRRGAAMNVDLDQGWE